MALNDLISNIILNDKFSGVFKKYEDELEDADKGQQKFNKSGNLLQKILGGLKPLGLAAGAGMTALATGAVYAGSRLIDVASQFEDATDAIIVGTGASGENLAAMEQVVKDLKGSSAGLNQEFGDLGAVVAEVNTRTGATGQGLEDLSSQILNLSRLTGGDAVNNVGLITRVMGDWGVALEDSANLTDRLFGASQAFGIGVDDLSAKVVQFGAPLRQMGFSLDESIALFGKWEKEGVNAELAIGSLRIAAGHFAKENIPLQEGLNQTITAIKNAKSDSEGLAIAMEVFGARAGPDMAAAIREGRFELDEAVKTLQATSGNLDDASERSLKFGDQFQIMKDKALTSLIPLGDSLLNLAETLLPQAEQGFETLNEFLTAAQPIFDEFSKELSENLGPAMLVIEDATLRIAKALGIATEDTDGMDLALGALKTTLDLVVVAVKATAVGFELMAEGAEKVRSAIDIFEGLADQIRTIKDLAGSVSFSQFASATAGAIGIPGFDGGGVVPGPIGQPRLATVHGQETIRTPQQEAALQNGRGSDTKIVNVYPQTGDPYSRAGAQRLGRSVMDAITGMA